MLTPYNVSAPRNNDFSIDTASQSTLALVFEQPNDTLPFGIPRSAICFIY